MNAKPIASAAAAALIFPAVLTAQNIGFHVGIAAPKFGATTPFGVVAGPTPRGAYTPPVHPYGAHRAWGGFIVPAAGFAPTATLVGPGTVAIWGPGTATIVAPGAALHIGPGNAAATAYVVPGYPAVHSGAVFVGGSMRGHRPLRPCRTQQASMRTRTLGPAFGGIGVPAPRCTR